MPAIEVSHLTKEYQLGTLKGLKQTLLDAGALLAGRKREVRLPFKALDDVSFSIEAGEVVGIIGHNGAGKSTLLKMLARVSTPTRGSIKVNGRIAPLIEVGAGFVPDFTGRENVYLNGSILGMSKKEIDRKFDEIVDFAEMAEFIDTPVKRYSSGMQVKLAFAVATSIESEILIVDEVLAVGDLAFQRKCFDRTEELIKRQGRTVLLVSHNIRQVQRMCSRVILMKQGRIIRDGNSAETCDHFYQMSNDIIHNAALKKEQRGIVSSGEIDAVEVDVIDETGEPTEAIQEGSNLTIRTRFVLTSSLAGVEFHVGTHTTDFLYLTGESSALVASAVNLGPGIHEVIHTIEKYPLVPGSYGVRFAVIDAKARLVFHGEGLRFFKIEPRSGNAPFQDELRLISAKSSWNFYAHAPCELRRQAGTGRKSQMLLSI